MKNFLSEFLWVILMRRSRFFHFTTLRTYLQTNYDSISLVIYRKENNQIIVDDIRFPERLYFKVDKKSNTDLIKEIDIEIKANILMGNKYNEL